MKGKKTLVLALLSSLAFIGCQGDDFNEDVKEQSSEVSVSSVQQRKANKGDERKEHLKEAFSYSLMKSLSESTSLRILIKEEALKMFNDDYEVLVYAIKDTVLDSGETVESLLNKHLEKGVSLDEILQIEPTLTILVPELPRHSFSAEIWEPKSEIPMVAMRSSIEKGVPIINPKLEKVLLPADVVPGFPVVVVKRNERVVSSLDNIDLKKLNASVAYRKNGVTLWFWDRFFDRNNTKRTTRGYKIDQTLIDAYNMYKHTDGWQRDYIYYGITPSKSKGTLSYDFQEHVKTFRMLGNGMEAYNTISQPYSDARYSNNHRIGTSHWTGGAFEFRISTSMVGKNGASTEFVNGFSLSPEKLFDLEYEVYSVPNFFISWFGTKRYYRLRNVRNKTARVDVPIFNWDLQLYPEGIRVNFEEVDNPQTIENTYTTTSKIATNFDLEFSFGIGKFVKIGPKFGINGETSRTSTVKVTTTVGSDNLWGTNVNFREKVIIGKSSSRWRTREYSTGQCAFTFEPHRVQ